VLQFDSELFGVKTFSLCIADLIILPFLCMISSMFIDKSISNIFMDDEKLVYKHMSNDERYICPTWSLKDEYKQYINSTRANYGTCLGTRVKNQVISHIEWQIMDDERMILRLKQTEQIQSHGKRSRYVDSASYEITT